MPTTRRRIPRPLTEVITPIAVEAWRMGDFHALHRALQIRPWQVSPFDAVGTPPAPDGTLLWAQSWPRAAALRAALIEAAGPPGRVGRHGDPLGPAC